MSIARLSVVFLLTLMKPGEPQPAALVFSLAGHATLEAPSETRRPVHFFDRLVAGSTVEVGPASRLAVAFRSGRRYELAAGAKAKIGKNDLEARSGAVRALKTVPPLPRLSPIAAEDRPGPKAGAVRVRAERIAGLYPFNGAAALAGATSLHFDPVEGGKTYRVEVHDRRGSAVFEAETRSPLVALPAELLKPGARYRWTVRTSERAGPVARATADFVTLSTRMAEAREALRKALTADGRGDSLALLAEVDWCLGLYAEAREELRSAVQASPKDTLLAEHLAEREQQMAYLQSP